MTQWHDASKDKPEMLQDVLAVREFRHDGEPCREYYITFVGVSGEWHNKYNGEITWWTELPKMPE